MEFIDPPENTRTMRSQVWKDRVNTLKENPTRWALIGEFSPGVASQIRSGTYKAFLDGDIDEYDTDAKKRYMSEHWEVRTARLKEDRRMSMWIRWIG